MGIWGLVVGALVLLGIGILIFWGVVILGGSGTRPSASDERVAPRDGTTPGTVERDGGGEA